MSEEAVRQTRSQKRALERDTPALDGEPKRVKLEKSELGSDKVTDILKAGEVKATIKVEVPETDEPVDMSTSRSEIKKERPSTPDDVIVLSDNESNSPCVNGISLKKSDTDLLMKSSPEERQLIIKQLKEELRLQEAKLVLLKKLRQSQIQKESVVQKTTNSSSNPPPLIRGSISSSKAPLQVSSHRSSGTVIPPPLVRGGSQVSKHSSVVMPPLVRGSQQIATLRQQQQQQQQHSSSGPPPLLLGPRTSVPNVQVQGQRIIQQGLIRVANVANTNVLVNIPQGSPTALKGSSVSSQSGIGSNSSGANDSPASRQAAAKLALRKQLEKTLLEIPPPKPPAPEFNFLPSAANNEFIYLVGLEMVVQNLLDLTKNKQQSQVGSPSLATKEPFTCAQCHTDFTSRWRQDKKNSSILCEQCMSSNQKKALKAEHTNRLKSAFVKALQQEQEIEQCILQQSALPSPKNSVSSSSSPGVKSEHVLVSPQYKTARSSLSQPQPNRAPSVNRYHSAIKQSAGQVVRTLPHAVVSVNSRGVNRGYSTTSQLQNAVAAAALVGRASKHAVRSAPNGSNSQAGSSHSSSGKASTSAWRKQSSTPAGVTMAYVNPGLPVLKTTSPADRQREYLLDMIPSRSISQTTNSWK